MLQHCQQALIAALACGSIAPLARAGEYWVDAINGNNLNSGLLQTDAWQTITHALENAPCDTTIRILPGVYDTMLGEVFPLSIECHSLIGEAGPFATIVQGGFIGIYLFSPTGVISAYSIEGLGFRDFTAAINCGLPAEFWSEASITFRNLRFEDCANGILYQPATTTLGGVEVLVEGVTFSNVSCGAALGFFLNGGIDVTLRDCLFRSCGHGLLINDNNFFGSYVVERCLFSGNFGKGVFANGFIQSLEIIDSVIVESHERGIVYQGQGGMSVRRCTVANNTAIGIVQPLLVENSVVFGNGDDICCYPGSAGQAVVMNSNIGDGDFVGQNGNIAVDPLFRNSAAADYRLSVASPCIDRIAPPVRPLLDFVSNQRNSDGDLDIVRLSDMGAYEFQTLELVGAPALGNTVHLDHWAAPGSHGVVFLALDLVTPPLQTPFGQFELPQNQMVGLARVHFSPTGMASVPFAIPNLPGLVGTDVHFQALVRSSAAPVGFAATDRVSLTIEP